MQTAKQEVEIMLQKLPNDTTLEDIQYNLYVLEKINRGMSRAENGESISHQDVRERLSKWID